MTFYKFGCQNAMYDTGSYHQPFCFTSQFSAMLSACANTFSVSLSTTLSYELSFLASLVLIAGVSIISLVCVLVASIILA